MRRSTAWVEAHFRGDSSTPTSRDQIKPADYVLRGSAFPFADLRCASDVFSLLRKIPAELKDWFPRPMGLFDVVVLCRKLENSMVIPHPMLVLPENDVGAFAVSGEVITRPLFTPEERDVTEVIPGIVLLLLGVPWVSKVQ